jgi:hypothetical protein
MNVIQHKETRQFIGMSGWWTPHLDEAAEFHSVPHAVRFCVERSIRDHVQLVPLHTGRARPTDLFPSER